ncbi:hypothetical protein [Hahella ganghwensis]|uniref:hypothetical protein n=1 Tax=Hahella ganghwensis TaxID=286420 RepID=UPI00035F108C|nr:hypothetical protein [Hahella ganghwensis]
MLSNEAIEAAKTETKYGTDSAHHEHNDCIRMAYQWLDAQTRTKGKMRKIYPLKHLIEKWAGRYVSASDVAVAATMHPDIYGEYPFFNISSRLTEPSTKRLEGISEAFRHSYRERFDATAYKAHE